MAGILTKSELADQYGMTTRTLAKLMNDRYFKQLKVVGYKKRSQYIPPKVLNVFFEIYGKPLKEDENE